MPTRALHDPDRLRDPQLVLELLRRAAYAAARAGYCVFPVKPGQKVPAIEDWEHEATGDPAAIAEWWTAVPRNIGIATGRSGVVVVDLDHSHGQQPPPPFSGARDGLDVLTMLAAAAAAPPPTDTFTVLTPSGGRHLYFRAPTGIELRNTQAKLGWRIDTRAHGGFVVAAGSVRPEGRYRVARPGPVRGMPAWLLELLTRPPRIPVGPRTPVRLPHGRAAAYVRGAVDRETAQVAAAAPGTSHATLLAAAGKLGQLVGAGALSEPDARAALLPAATAHLGKWSCDCTEQSIRRTIDDGLRYGQQLPRRLQLI